MFSICFDEIRILFYFNQYELMFIKKKNVTVNEYLYNMIIVVSDKLYGYK